MSSPCDKLIGTATPLLVTNACLDHFKNRARALRAETVGQFISSLLRWLRR